MPQHATPLKFLMPHWFAVVMGLAGLSLAWLRAVGLMGEAAGTAGVAIGALATAVFGLLMAASVLRFIRHPQALAEDLRHPVRHAFVAALPASLILLVSVGVTAWGGTAWMLPVLDGLWWLGSLSQLATTVWVLARWWQPPPFGSSAGSSGGLTWAGLTPVLFIPVVGNVLVPLAGVALGHAEWSMAQFGIGLFFWPVMVALIGVRIAVQGLWPERMMPTVFMFTAPPAVIGSSVLELGAPQALGWLCWGIGVSCLLWAGTQARRILALPFGMAHWGVSFPLAAMASLTLRLAQPGNTAALWGPPLLALATLVILGLTLATLRGLRDGSLLAPEPVAMLQPAA
jgi:tellurite resistance protein